ncbi:hypothetical protein PENSPDRAFT_676377 [Peniophora sp. CONT]|nr:hypothetical protein PENSPDRAFT_676377 [Peniophora sp. CONT]
MRIAQKLHTVVYFLHTLFLFTKSDIKTTVIPVASLAVAGGPLADPFRLVHVIFWIWLHVLQFDVSNQTMDPEEDAQNKRDRPLPAGRMSLPNAVRLRWLLVPLCFGLSILYSGRTLCASVALVALTIIYNELATHKMHWGIRNAVNALGFASFEVGATLIAGRDCTRLDAVGFYSILASTGIFATTIHAQDFKDADGDKAIGRQTIPIVFPRHARLTVIIPLFMWSIGLSVFWQLEMAFGILFTALCLWVGTLYLIAPDVPHYQVAFYWYNVWLSAAHALPAYYRLYARAL